MQEGLSFTLMESPSVSGVQGYKELCVAAKKEEKRLIELQKKQQYLKSDRLLTTHYKRSSPTSTSKGWLQGSSSRGSDKLVGNWDNLRHTGNSILYTATCVTAQIT